MKHESAVQAVKELMRKDSVFRSVIQGWGVATLLIGLFMFYMGANTYIQSYKQTDWVFGSAYITDISELNRSKVGRGGINYSMTYEYEVDGTHYTGKYGPLANSIEVGRSIRIKYDPSAPENSTGFLAPSGNVLRNDSCRAWIFHVGHPRPSAEASAGTASKRDSRLRTAGRETHCAPQSPRALRLRYSYGGTQYPPNPCADTHIPAFRIYPHAHPKRNILITGTM